MPLRTYDDGKYQRLAILRTRLQEALKYQSQEVEQVNVAHKHYNYKIHKFILYLLCIV